MEARWESYLVPKVVHCKKAPPGTFIYVGRPTKYGNKFTHKSGTTATHVVRNRDEAVEAYKSWILSPEQATLRDDIKRELRGADLACWCAPLRCHAEILLEIANED